MCLYGGASFPFHSPFVWKLYGVTKTWKHMTRTWWHMTRTWLHMIAHYCTLLHMMKRAHGARMMEHDLRMEVTWLAHAWHMRTWARVQRGRYRHMKGTWTVHERHMNGAWVLPATSIPMGDALTAITPSDDGPDGREVVMGKAAVSLAGGRDRW